MSSTPNDPTPIGEPEAKPEPIEARAQQAIESIMAGGNPVDIARDLANGYTDEQVAELRRRLSQSRKPESAVD